VIDVDHLRVDPTIAARASHWGLWMFVKTGYWAAHQPDHLDSVTGSPPITGHLSGRVERE
jgi:hypothetical protein